MRIARWFNQIKPVKILRSSLRYASNKQYRSFSRLKNKIAKYRLTIKPADIDLLHKLPQKDMDTILQNIIAKRENLPNNYEKINRSAQNGLTPNTIRKIRQLALNGCIEIYKGKFPQIDGIRSSIDANKKISEFLDLYIIDRWEYIM